MAYISADDVKMIRNALKAKFPKFKFSARKGSGSYSVDVTIKSGPIDFISNYNDTVYDNRMGCTRDDYLQVNQYWFQDHFSGDAKDMIKEVLSIIKSSPDNKWYNNSDAMTDYFDTAFYIHLNIGRYNKPYTVTTK